MSKPSNRLASFRSYSYYHVLAICDSSDTATKLSGSSDLSTWYHATSPVGGTEDLGKYSVKELPDGGRYCIIINGSTDAEFTITKATWNSFTAASATMNDRNTSIALEGSLQISEPRGIAFLDQTIRCTLQLGVDSANAFWVLKTFFVGYKSDGSLDGDSVEHITDITPLVFIAYDVVGSFGVTGGEYEINFVAAANGASRMPQYSKSTKAINMTAGGTLQDTLTELANKINQNYDRYYQCVYDQVNLLPEGKELAASLRKVKYSIVVDEPYNSSEYTVTDQAPQMKDNGDCSSPVNLHFDSGTSIEDAIHRVLGMCDKIKQEASAGVSGTKYIAKIQSWVHSEPTNPKEIEFSVGYKVFRQVQPHSVSFEEFSDGTITEETKQANVIEFDYLYTGKNIDILDFDIKMNMGMAFLQAMTITNPYKYPGEHTSASGTIVDGRGLALRGNGSNIPVHFGTQIKTAAIKDTKDHVTSSQFAYSMTKHASLESLEASVKITGNSNLLGSVNHTTFPTYVKENVPPPNSDGYATFDRWSLLPSFAKINIKMPRNNDDISLFSGTKGSGNQTSSDDPSQANDYAVDFWFTGYYYVYQIEHTFDNGEFYQTMHAIGIPEHNTFNVNKENTTKLDTTITTAVESCYDRVGGCGISGSSNNPRKSSIFIPENRSLGELQEDGAQPQPKKSKVIIPEHASDASVLLQSVTDPSQIAGWDKAPPEVKEAIIKANAQSGLNDLPLLAMVAGVESTMGTDPNMNASGKKYVGVFQIGPNEFKRFGPPGGSRYNTDDNALAAANYLKHIRDNELQGKIMDREPSRLETYLGYQQGPGGARTVLKRVSAGDTRQGAISAAAAAGNAIGDTSAQTIYNTIARKMSRMVRGGVPTVESKIKGPRNTISNFDPQGDLLASIVQGTPENSLIISNGYIDDAIKTNAKQNKHVMVSTIDCNQTTANEKLVASDCLKTPTTVEHEATTPSATQNNIGQV